MRFLADESCDHRIVRALRAAGHDVRAVSDLSPRAADTEVIALAAREARLVLTEDRDFGQLVYAHGQPTRGVIYLRYAIALQRQIARDIVNLVAQRGESLAGCFVVMQPGRVRISRAPRG